MRAKGIIRYVALIAAGGLVVVILLAACIVTERQVDADRMVSRTNAIFFGLRVWEGRPHPMPFATRFPQAVANRESRGWFTTSKRGVLSGMYANGPAGRMAADANTFAGMVDGLEIRSADADRIAARIIELIAERREFFVAFDDRAENLFLKTEDGTIIDTCPIPMRP